MMPDKFIHILVVPLSLQDKMGFLRVDFSTHPEYQMCLSINTAEHIAKTTGPLCANTAHLGGNPIHINLGASPLTSESAILCMSTLE